MTKKQLSPFEQAYADARSRWVSKGGDPTFSYGGKSYSVASREEVARQKEMAQSPTRGRGYNRADTSTARSSAEIPGAGPYKAPAATESGGMSEARRNIQNIVMAVPAARAVGGAVGRAVQAATATRAAPVAKRIEPLLHTSRMPETGKFQASSKTAKDYKPEPDKMDRIPAFKKGGLVTKKKR
jgi:hypothetical protein